MANKQASKTNKSAPITAVRREDQPGFKKVNRAKRRGTGVARVQQGLTLSDAIRKGDRGFDNDHATNRPAKPQRRIYVDHRKQALMAVEYPKVAALTKDPAAFNMLEEVLQAFGNAKATADKKKLEVTRELALEALAKRNPEAHANEEATAKGLLVAKEALNWAHDKLTQSVAGA